MAQSGADEISAQAGRPTVDESRLTPFAGVQLAQVLAGAASHGSAGAQRRARRMACAFLAFILLGVVGPLVLLFVTG